METTTTPGMDSSSRAAPGSSWADDEEDDCDFVLEELPDTDDEDDDEDEDESEDSGSGVDYEPESETGIEGQVVV